MRLPLRFWEPTWLTPRRPTRARKWCKTSTVSRPRFTKMRPLIGRTGQTLSTSYLARRARPFRTPRKLRGRKRLRGTHCRQRCRAHWRTLRSSLRRRSPPVVSLLPNCRRLRSRQSSSRNVSTSINSRPNCLVSRRSAWGRRNCRNRRAGEATMSIWLAAIFFLATAVHGAFAQNAIVTENQLPGTPQSQWDDSGTGSTTLLGFTTDISVNHGSTVSFKIQSGTNNWKIDIYRLGYYQGNGARLITTINMTSAAPQPAPITDPTTGEVDAGNWTITASWAVPANAVSGVYLAHLVDLTNTSNENQIPFIVRADESTSDILFQTSDTTWHAYNGWGGANLYGGNGPGGDSAPGRAYKVSYNRPIATRDGVGTYAGPQDFLFGAEYAAIFWLEQNGYDVSYISGIDTATNGSLLLNHKVFMDAGH